jgi:dihydrolipoamide dehydrogenase
MQDFDVVIIGAGPGGYVAAIRAAQLGLKTAIIEKDHLGGVCLNWGCIPTKALLRTAEVKQLIDHASDFGLKVGRPEIMLDKIVDRSRQIAAQLSKGIQHLMKKNKITVFDGQGTLKGGGVVTLMDKAGKTTELKAHHILIATGARARTLPNLEADGEVIWTARHAMTPKTLPKSLVIVGSGAIGIEFASFYRTMGTDVTIVERLDRILPQEDPEISALALKAFEKQGIKFLFSSTVDHVEKAKSEAKVFVTTPKGKETFEASAVILAIGIIGNTENLGLEHTKAKVEKNQIQVNEWGQTDEPGLYAIGDVAGAPWLAHKASHEALICVEKIANVPGTHPLDKTKIPGCTYSLPQIASIGLTEEKAKSLGKKIKVGRFPYGGNGKAIALGESDGLIKTIFDAETGEFLGAHLIGAEATELIQGFGIAKTLEATEIDFMHTVFPHPTLSEMMHESVLNAFGRALHS